MKIVLTAVEKPLYEAWKKYCGDLEFVSVHLGSIFNTECDAVVSPANSFGFMDGGIDYLYSQHFGWDLEQRLQKKIRDEFNGELLVGQATIVPTNDKKIPWLISAPTMRVPVNLGKTTVNPYLAARAVLHCAKENGIETVAFPGLGTGVGAVKPEICAIQVREAIDEVLLELYVYPINWPDALDRHTYLYTGLRSGPPRPIFKKEDETGTPCPTCNGEGGWMDDGEPSTCDDCGGSGRQTS